MTSVSFKNISPWYVFGLLVFSIACVNARDLTPTWLILVFSAFCFAAAAFWFRNLQDVLLFGFVFSSSIYLTKALVVEGGVYTPGLSVTLSDLFLLPFLALWLGEKILVRRSSIYWSPLHLFPLLFLLWSWSSIIITEDKLAGFFMCITFTKCFVIFVALADYLKTSRHIRLVLYGFAAALCVHFGMAFLEVVAGNMVVVQGAKTTTVGTSLVFEQAGGTHAFRPSGFMGHPNALADLMTFVLPPMLILLMLGRRLLTPFTYAAVGVFCAGSSLALLLTLSRAGWISFACSVCFLLYVGCIKGVILKKYIVLVFLSAMVIFSVSALVFPTVYLRITQSDQRSSESRIAMMYQAKLIIQRNLIAGVGLGGYNRSARTNIPEYFSHLSPGFQSKLLQGVVHNKYLLVMAELGVVGIVFFVMMFWRFVMAVIRIKNWENSGLFLLTLGVSAGIVAQTVFYLFDHFYADVRITLVYLFFGLLAGLIKMQKTEVDSLADSRRLIRQDA